MPPFVTQRPFGFSGGVIPLDQARWILTHAIDAIEMLPAVEGETLRGVGLKSGRLMMKTVHQGVLTVGPVKTIDGKDSLVGLPRNVEREIRAIVEWEHRNPGEKKWGVPGVPMAELVVRVGSLISDGIDGEVLIDLIDANLAQAEQTGPIRGMRRALRDDPKDATGTSAKTLESLRAEVL